MSENLPNAWYESPNIRFFTLTDFMDLLAELGLNAEQIITIDRRGRARSREDIGHWTNLLTEQAIFLIGRN